MYTKEEWLLGSLGAIALLGFVLALNSALERYSTSAPPVAVARAVR